MTFVKISMCFVCSVETVMLEVVKGRGERLRECCHTSPAGDREM